MHDVEEVLLQAQAAAESGEWEQVVVLLADLRPRDRDQHVAAELLRARAALHDDSPARTIEMLDDLAGLLTRPDELLTAAILRGEAVIALGHADDGLALLEQAAATAVGDRRFAALLELARNLWRAQRIEPLAAVLDTILRANETQTVPRLILARAFELYGWLELRRFRRPIAARHFGDALDALGLSAPYDPQLRGALLHALLAIALDTLDLRLLRRVRTEIATTDWEPAALHARARALQPLLVTGELLLGQLDAAWEIGFALREAAGAGAAQIAADLSVAQIARAAGETWTPARLVEKCAAAARVVDWAGTGAAGARTLLSLIAESAAGDPDTARGLLAIAVSLPDPKPTTAFEDDSDLAALEDLARAAIDAAVDDHKRQAASLRKAVARWHAIGNDLGEAQALLDLVAVVQDERALARADELTRLVPRSWLRRRFEWVAARAQGVQLLTRTEHKVMLALIQGLSTEAIAIRFSRSTNTIRNQIRRVFIVMGVRSRSALVVKCAAMGLLAEEDVLARS